MSARETVPVAPAGELPIKITDHACVQARKRHPSFWGKRGVGGVYFEVSEALRNGRSAKTQPRWASPGKRFKHHKSHSRGGSGRYVWNEERTRCYVLVRGLTARGTGWVVLTTLSTVGDDRALGRAPLTDPA